MSDSGEALIDAQARLAERMEEREENRMRALRSVKTPVDRDRERRIESLRLARIELERQRSATTHAGRQQQLTQALEELDRQMTTAASSRDSRKPEE